MFNVFLQRQAMSVCDALPSPGLNALEGPTMCSCGKLGLEGVLPTSSTKEGLRGVLEIPGLD
jgi:hypothetical protein